MKCMTSNKLFSQKDIIFYFLLILLVVVAFMQRFPYLGISPIDYDEGFTVYYSSRNLCPWSNFLEGSIRANYFPPLDFLLHHFVYQFFGITEKTIRFVPCFFDILTVFFLGLLCKKLCGRVLGLFCAFLWAMSPTAIYYAMQARLYSQFCFAFIFYLFSLSCFRSRLSVLNGLFLILSIVYGFNVHILFICALPIGLGAFIIDFLSSCDFKQDNKTLIKHICLELFYLFGCVFLALIIVSIFYYEYKIFSTVRTASLVKHSFYSLNELFNRFVLRVYDAVYADTVCYWGNISKKGCFFIWLLIVLFLSSLYMRKDLFIKSAIVLSFFAIPFFDILIIFKGFKFTGRLDIRFVYWFVPMIIICLGYSFNIIYSCCCKLLKLLFINSNFNYKVIAFIVVSLLLIAFDVFIIKPNRLFVQKFNKNGYVSLRKWINDKSTSNKIDFYMSKMIHEWRAYDYINVLDYSGKTNVNCFIKDKINSNIFQEEYISDSKIREYLEGKILLGIVIRDGKFPWDENLFSIVDTGVEKLYILNHIYNLNSSLLKKYEDLFGKRFIHLFTGIYDDYSSLTNATSYKPYYSIPENLITNGNFYSGLDGWKYDNNVKVIQDNNRNCVEMCGQSRIWQSVNTVSGHVYSLSFKLKAPNSSALAIFRDEQNNIESYIFCTASNEPKTYIKNFKSYKNGKYNIYLVYKGKDKCYFYDVFFTENESE